MKYVLLGILLILPQNITAQTFEVDQKFLCQYIRNIVFPNVTFAVFRERYDIDYTIEPYKCAGLHCNLSAYQILVTYQNYVSDDEGRIWSQPPVKYLFVDIDSDCRIDMVDTNEEFYRPKTSERVYIAAVKHITEFLKEGRTIDE